MLTLFKKTFQRGWVNFVRNSGISIATCFIIGMTIFLISSLFLFKDVSHFLISGLQEKIDVSVYFKDTAQENDILAVKDEVSQIPEVKEVKYVSKEQALETFTEKYKDNPVIMASLAEVGNPLFAALNIKAKQASQYQAITNFLANVPQKDLIDKVDYYQRKPVIERISSISATVNIIGIIFSLILGIVAVLVAFNQIRLAIYNSREEIGIQRLVGASDWFIRGPFLTQGAISGAMAGLATFLVFGFSVFLLSSKFTILFPGFNIFSSFLSKFWLYFLIQLFAGVGLGVLSSIIAVRKYLEV